MVLHHHTKYHPKWSNGSWDIESSKIERSDWPRAFWAINQEPDFSQTCGFHRMIKNHNILQFTSFPEKTNENFFCKSPKTLFLGHFGPIFPNFGKTGFFPKNLASSLFFPYNPLTSCKKSEKTYDPIPGKWMDGRTSKYRRYLTSH